MTDNKRMTQGNHIRVTHFDEDGSEPLTVIKTTQSAQEPLVLSARFTLRF
jgi:hypothetical protein